MIIAILAFWFGYKKGRDSGRNPVLWSVICGGSFIGVQLLVGLAIGIFMGVGIATLGWSESVYEDYQIFITLAAIAASIVTLLLILRYLDRIPDEPVDRDPPPPPTFNQN